jgi:hypothetical protein
VSWVDFVLFLRLPALRGAVLVQEIKRGKNDFLRVKRLNFLLYCKNEVLY